MVGFSPRKDAIVLYLSSQFKDREELLSKFGKHKTAKACIYVKKMSDIHIEVLKEMIINAVAHTSSLYP
jgi:predicted HTH transcriptional regulator